MNGHSATAPEANSLSTAMASEPMDADSEQSSPRPPPFTPKSRSASHRLSFASLDVSSLSRKGRYAEPDTTDTHADRASISMPPPSSSAPSRPFIISRPSSMLSIRRQSGTSEAWTDSSRGSPRQDIAIEDFETPRLAAGIMPDYSHYASLPEAALRPRGTTDADHKRMSSSSMYSLGSARAGGDRSSATSANGSEAGGRPTSGSISGGVGVAISPPDSTAATTALSVTTSTTSPYGSHGSSTSHQLTARETSAADISRRNAVARGEIPRSAIPRSRSRAKRRFSGSTAASSHSPSSERGLHLREKDDVPPKPAPIGIIGVCALDVKARSKPSRNILGRLISKGEFEVKVFGDKVILDEDIENWPVCDFLISFYSDGFPLDKAIAYVKARKPFCVNDVPMQKILWDRRICLRILDKINVPTPKRLEVNRDGGPSIMSASLAKHVKDVTGVVLEGPEDGTGGHSVAPRKVELLDDGDTLSVDGALLKKPFVEKPISGEDHNICIYFPKSEGGGARKLFRKIGNKSSEYIEGLTVPRVITDPGSSFLYEKFMKVENFEDVKAYTVGTTFCHAETRKSPVVDGLVRRNTHGKEIRYITPLTKEEAAMAGRIATSFGQRVCGFDLLRSEGKSFVIDVNGWSFVKDNEEYYDQCASILKKMFIEEKQKKQEQKKLVVPSPASASASASTAPSVGAESRVASPETSETENGYHRRDTIKDAHRSALQTMLAKSPSLSKLHHLGHHKSSANPSSPELSAATAPLTSPPTLERPGPTSFPVSELLPPPATSTPVVPATADSSVPNMAKSDSDLVLPPPEPKHAWKLKGMVSVIRHADRTPKQKYKFTFHTKPFIELLKGHQEEVLLTGHDALESVANAVDLAIREGVEDRGKLKTLRNVLIKKGGWAGTKVQIKPMFRERKPEEILPENTVPVIGDIPVDLTKVIPATSSEFSERIIEDDVELNRSPTRADSISGVTLSRITAAENSLVLDKLQLIIKWGGEPTHSARYQSQELGENMRNDLLLMNKEVLDEVHVFSSSERRVTTSAQIWTAAFLDDKNIPSDYITVRKDLLDDSNAAKDEMDRVKKKLKILLREGEQPPPQFAWPPNMPEPSIVQGEVVQLMKFHRRVMRHNYGKLYGGATTSLNSIVNPGDKTSGENTPAARTHAMAEATATNTIQARWCCGEDAELFRERWEKLFGEFCDGDKVDPSKISELYDTMKFDALHNRQFLEWVFTPSKSILEEEEALEKKLRNTVDKSRDSEDAKSLDDAKVDKKETVPMEKSDTNKSVHRRLFRRSSKSTLAKPVISNSEESPEQYFHLFTGNSQTKAKTDSRLEKLRQLYKLAKVLFDFICPQEYGMTDKEKLEIGLLTSLPLLKEIVQDLEEMQASDLAKSFFYFTKESHIYTLLNCILEGGIETKISRAAIPELDYLSQICFELYESETTPVKPQTIDEAGNPVDVFVDAEEQTFKYSIRITISPGCHTFDPLDVQLDSKHCIGCAQRRTLTPHADWKFVIDTLRAKFHQVKLPKSFLAVNLSESHTFHKKEDSIVGDTSIDEMKATGEITDDKEEEAQEIGEVRGVTTSPVDDRESTDRVPSEVDAEMTTVDAPATPTVDVAEKKDGAVDEVSVGN